jgi:hypothetical protein
MNKSLFIFIFFAMSCFSNENLVAQKQNTLYVQNLIEIEEKIAQNFEKYIVTEFKIPNLINLINDNYLGRNFSVKNMMGNNINFKNTSDLQIEYAITKNEFINSEDYLILLYNRDLYRDYTTVNFQTTTDKKIDLTKSYVEFKLKSPEAITIFNILKSGATIEKNCSDNLTNSYCNYDKNSIRWYNANSNWIEYSKKNFNNGNITISHENIIQSEISKLKDLKIGSYVFIKNKTKNVKLADDSSGNLQILKVE